MSRQGTLKHRPQAGLLLAALLACLLFMPIHAAAAEQVGRVLVATGSVTAEQEDASARALGRRDPIYAGDRIRTAARAQVQIRFEDGAMVDLDPSSTFEVEEYTTEDEDGGGSAVMSFLKGAMRTITGAIGGSREDTYRMNTTVATIGVRGTAYALEYCDEACVEEGGQAGLYGRVDKGEVEVDGPGGTGTFGKGHYFFVPDGGAPERIVAPPDGILEGEGETGAGGDDDRIEDVSIRPLDTGEEDGAGLDGNDTDLLNPDFKSGDNLDLEPRPGRSVDVLFGGAFVGGEAGGLFESALFFSPDDGDVRLDAADAVVGADFPSSGFIDATDMSLVQSDTTTVFGGGTDFDVTWGRWEGALTIDGVEDSDGSDGFAFVYTDPSNITPSSSLVGSPSYGTAIGPLALATDDGLWEVDFYSMQANFGATPSPFVELFDFTLFQTNGSGNLSFPTQDTGTIDIASSSFELNSLSFTGSANYTGNINGRFVGDNGQAVIIRFELEENSGNNTITGVQIVGPPS